MASMTTFILTLGKILNGLFYNGFCILIKLGVLLFLKLSGLTYFLCFDQQNKLPFTNVFRKTHLWNICRMLVNTSANYHQNP